MISSLAENLTLDAVLFEGLCVNASTVTFARGVQNGSEPSISNAWKRANTGLMSWAIV